MKMYFPFYFLFLGGNVRKYSGHQFRMRANFVDFFALRVGVEKSQTGTALSRPGERSENLAEERITMIKRCGLANWKISKCSPRFAKKFPIVKFRLNTYELTRRGF